jgi:hypothetical protein
MYEVFGSISWAPAFWALMGIFAAAGLLAMVAPKRFAALTQRSSQWVDTEKILTALDRKIDVDQYVLPHSRLFGAFVLAGVAALAFLYVRYFA